MWSWTLMRILMYRGSVLVGAGRPGQPPPSGTVVRSSRSAVELSSTTSSPGQGSSLFIVCFLLKHHPCPLEIEIWTNMESIDDEFLQMWRKTRIFWAMFNTCRWNVKPRCDHSCLAFDHEEIGILPNIHELRFYHVLYKNLVIIRIHIYLLN